VKKINERDPRNKRRLPNKVRVLHTFNELFSFFYFPFQDEASDENGTEPPKSSIASDKIFSQFPSPSCSDNMNHHPLPSAHPGSQFINSPVYDHRPQEVRPLCSCVIKYYGILSHTNDVQHIRTN